MEVSKRLVAATSLWAISVCLMAVDLMMTLTPDLGEASVLVGLMACVPTGSIAVERIVQREHDRTVRGICEILGRAEVDGKLRHLR